MSWKEKKRKQKTPLAVLLEKSTCQFELATRQVLSITDSTFRVPIWFFSITSGNDWGLLIVPKDKFEQCMKCAARALFVRPAVLTEAETLPLPCKHTHHQRLCCLLMSSKQEHCSTNRLSCLISMSWATTKKARLTFGVHALQTLYHSVNGLGPGG